MTRSSHDGSSHAPTVTVYIPCHNYGRFVAQAIKSVRDQSYQDWELIVVDDGSVDETHDVLGRFARLSNITVLSNKVSLGLRAVANQCFAMARGEFVLRLDADDSLHPRALEMLVGETQAAENVGVVFPDFYYIDESGRVVGVETLPGINGGYEAHSFPPHGAGSLVRLDLIRRFGGLDESLSTQDGHELWLRLLEAGAGIRHVPLPLFFYRRHLGSLSADEGRVLADRATIKEKLTNGKKIAASVIGVLTVCNTDPDFPDIPFTDFAGATLIEREIEEALLVAEFDALVVSTDCPRVAAFTRERVPGATVIERAEQLRHHDAAFREILREVVDRLRLEKTDVLCILNLHTPFRRAHHIRDALANYLLYDVDSVVSVYEERNLIYRMGTHGLEPMNPSWQYMLRREREVIYVDNAAVRILPVGNLENEHFLGNRIGHVLMGRDEGFKINSPADLHRLTSTGDFGAPTTWLSEAVEDRRDTSITSVRSHEMPAR